MDRRWLIKTKEGILIQVQVQPRASRTEVVGPHGEPPRLKVRIAAPPVAGAANQELMRFLKKKLGVPVYLVSGETSKMKDVRCINLTDEEVWLRLMEGINLSLESLGDS